PWGTPADLPGRVESVQQRHRKVEDRHIRMKVAGQPDGLVAVGRFGNHFEALALQKRPEPLPDDYVVVGEEDSRWHAIPFSGTRILSVVPLPGLELIESVPPRLAARSLMPISPSPSLCVWADRAFASKPRPLSTIEQTSAAGRRSRRTAACVCRARYTQAGSYPAPSRRAGAIRLASSSNRWFSARNACSACLRAESSRMASCCLRMIRSRSWTNPALTVVAIRFAAGS